MDVVVLSIFVLVCLAAAGPSIEDDGQEILVRVSEGLLRGRTMTSEGERTIFAFLGIPYAKPPLGDLRFQPPVSPLPWEGERDATKDAPMCIQRNLYIRSKTIDGQEDCLYLNVYTPRLPDSGKENLDVMVWFHGGGWFAGTGNSFVYGPQALLDREIVLVTLNYRLGALGFLCTEDSASPGNYGLKDQVQALRWVKQNIKQFGGNPDSVTIFGESAGGASVHFHMMSPLSKGLFHRGISESGTALVSWAVATNARQQAFKLAKVLGCPSESSADIVKCLTSVPAEKIVSMDVHFKEWDMDPMIPFKPCVEKGIPEEKAFIPGSPLELLTEGKFNPVPWITGITSGEGALKASAVFDNPLLVEELNADFARIAPLSLFYRDTSPQVDVVTQRLRDFYFGDKQIDYNTIQNVIDLYTDAWFLAGADRAVTLHANDGRAPVFYYLLSYRGSRSFSSLFGDPTRDYGVCHADELLYLFKNNIIRPELPPTESDRQMTKILTTLWTNFARTGNPTPEINDLVPVQWEAYDQKNRKYLRLDITLRMKEKLFENRVQFWESLPLSKVDSVIIKEEL